MSVWSPLNWHATLRFGKFMWKKQIGVRKYLLYAEDKKKMWPLRESVASFQFNGESLYTTFCK